MNGFLRKKLVCTLSHTIKTARLQDGCLSSDAMTRWDTKTNAMNRNSGLSQQPYQDHFKSANRQIQNDAQGVVRRTVATRVLGLDAAFQQAQMMEPQDPCQVAKGSRGDVLAAGCH